MTVLRTSGAILQAHLDPFAEPCPFQQEVAVDAAEFLGQGGEVPVAPEGVPGEVGEFHHQLPGADGIRVDERGDGIERVVDEVRADLGAKRTDLGLHQEGPGRFEFGEFQLGGNPVGHLAGGPDQPGPGRRGQGRHRPDHPGAGRIGAITALKSWFPLLGFGAVATSPASVHSPPGSGGSGHLEHLCGETASTTAGAPPRHRPRRARPTVSVMARASQPSMMRSCLLALAAPAG